MLKDFEYYDLNTKWNGYGKVVDLSDIDESKKNNLFKQFSEGSKELEICLISINKLNIKTIACCKGNHLSISADDKPNVSVNAYIFFENDKWLNYLSTKTITFENTYFDNKAIKYYGTNNDIFFKQLNNDFITGIKDNKKEIEKYIGKKVPTEIKKQAYINSIKIIGFNDKEIKSLSKLYFEFKELNSHKKDPDTINKSINIYNHYKELLIKYIKDHNNN